MFKLKSLDQHSNSFGIHFGRGVHCKVHFRTFPESGTSTAKGWEDDSVNFWDRFSPVNPPLNAPPLRTAARCLPPIVTKGPLCRDVQCTEEAPSDEIWNKLLPFIRNHAAFCQEQKALQSLFVLRGTRLLKGNVAFGAPRRLTWRGLCWLICTPS